jgi:ABC-type Fe3+/spermidine/putrescine transport system ATPase subunit
MSNLQSELAVLVDRVTHRYGLLTALSDVTLPIEQGSFVTLLGPSGCGKTTLLRILAGFLQPTEGRVLLSGKDVTALPPHKRPVNTVFQRPSLFPHLDVGENVAFSLRLAHVPNEEVKRRVAEALALVRLEGYERRRSHELSGGQMQRVALARVLVARPRVLLLDEPLSALDLAIRLEMEAELRRVHREIGATFVYVTHDQREALALSDRIVVFNQGRIEQVGRPEEIYRAPASPFAARFVGDANVVPVSVLGKSDRQTRIAIGATLLTVNPSGGVDLGAAWLVLRPEVIRVSGTESADNASEGRGLSGVVRDFSYRGSGYVYRIAVAGLPDLVKAEVAAEGTMPVPVGHEVTIAWDSHACALLPEAARPV